MFNLFKKKSNHPIAVAFESASLGQKQSILNLLLMVAGCDSPTNPHPEEMKLLNSYTDIFDARSDQSMARLQSYGVQGIIKDLSTLSKDQKELLVTMVHGMICIDGQPNETELECATNFLNPIGIDDDEYVRIVTKAEAVTRNLRL